MELEITTVELEMKKSDPNCGEEQLTECGGVEMVKNVDKEGSRRTVGGMDQQDDVGRDWRWNLVTGKWVTRRRMKGRLPEKNGVWRHVESCFPTRFSPTCRSASCASESKVSSRRRVGWKKSPAARRSDGGGGDGSGGGFQKETRSPKKNKKLVFPSDSDTM